MAFMYSLSISVFTMIYVSISTNIECFVDDISIEVARLNEHIDCRVSIRTELKQFIELHLHCYEYVTKCFLYGF